MNEYDFHKVPFETRVDMLNHFPCYPVSDRVSRGVNDFYANTVKEMLEKGLRVCIPKNCDRYKEELSGIDLPFAPDFKSATIWNRYGRILNILQTISARKDEQMQKAVAALVGILNSQSTTLYDITHIIATLNEVARSLDGEAHKDGYRELFDMVFKDLLPYKLHAYGLTTAIDVLTSDIKDASVTDIERGYDQRYLEMLINLFMASLQGLRGKSLDETKSRLKTIAVLIYLFITGVRSTGWTEDDLYFFTSYIDKMLNYGVGHHISNLVFEMMEKPATYFSITKNLNESDEFLNYAIQKRNRYVNDDIVKANVEDNGLDKAWNQMLIVGNGYFADANLEPEQVDAMCYEALRITPDFISNYVEVDPSAVSFTIPENNIGYIRKDTDCDICKIYRKQVQGGKPEALVLMYSPKLENVYALFNVADSKDTYGISLRDIDNSRQILKVGADDSKYNYNLVMGGDI